MFDKCRNHFKIALKRAGKAIVCKGHGRPQKDLILNGNSMIYIDIILDFYTGANLNSRIQIYIFTHDAVFAQMDSFPHLSLIPNLTAAPNDCFRADFRGRMDINILHSIHAPLCVWVFYYLF